MGSIRIAAVSDVHFGLDSAGSLRPDLERLGEAADVLLVAGDLTRLGQPDEAEVLAAELRELPVPVYAVLGNHDHHAGRQDEIARLLEAAGTPVLEGRAATLDLPGGRLGLAGVKGFCGGFAGGASEFGEWEMKAFAAASRHAAEALEAGLEALEGLEADYRVALVHYAPVTDTLVGERPEIWPFLGSHLLGMAVDRVGADLVLHGHAHAGREMGRTPGGVPVRNVAQPVIGSAYRVYTLARAAGNSEACLVA